MLGRIRPAHQVGAQLHPQPPQWFRFPQSLVQTADLFGIDPGRMGPVGFPAQDQIRQGSACERRGGNAVTEVAARPAQAGVTVEAHHGLQLPRDTQRTAPGMREINAFQEREKREQFSPDGFENRIMGVECPAYGGIVKITAPAAESDPVIGGDLSIGDEMIDVVEGGSMP